MKKGILRGIQATFLGGVILAMVTAGLSGCTNQPNSSTNIKDQSIVELTVPYEETSFYINTHYIIKIEPYTYYDYHTEFTGPAGYQIENKVREEDKPHEGSTIYLNGYEKTIFVKESPEKILELIGE